MVAKFGLAPASRLIRTLSPAAWFVLTLVVAAGLWSGTLRTDATPYGDGSRILPWLSFVQSQPEWPSWNPFRNGGYPLFADPEQFWFLVPFINSASPYANLQLNLALFLALLLTVPPIWLAARRLDLTPPWAAVATLLAAFNESMVLAEQSGRFLQLFDVASFAWVVAVLLKPKRALGDYAVLAFAIAVWLCFNLQYALIPGLAIFSAFVASDVHRLGPVKGLLTGTLRAVAVGLAGLALSAIVALPTVAHFGNAYLPNGFQSEPVVTASWSQAGRFILPSLPGTPVFLSFLILPAALIAVRNGAPDKVLRSITLLWALLLFLALFVVMCVPGIGPLASKAYGYLPIVSMVRQLVGIALIMVLLASLWAVAVFQGAAFIRASELGQSTRLLIATYLGAAAVVLAITAGPPFVIVSFVVAAILALVAIILILSRLAPTLARQFDPKVGALGVLLAALSIVMTAPSAFVETLPGTRRPIHVTNAIEQPETMAAILADTGPYVSILKPGAAGVSYLHSRRRAGTGFSLLFPKSYAYTLAYLSSAFDLTQQRPHWVGTTTCTGLDPRALDLLAVRYLLCRPSDIKKGLPPGYVRVGPDPAPKGYVLLRRNDEQGGTLRVFCRWRAEPDGGPAAVRETVLQAFAQGIAVVPAGETALARADGDTRSGALAPDCPTSGTSPVTVSMIKDSANKMVLEASSPRAGLLVIPDNFDRGWTATVNGESVALERAFFAYRGVLIASGKSEIRLIYADPFARWGAMVSGLSIVALSLLGAGWLVRRRSRRRS